MYHVLMSRARTQEAAQAKGRSYDLNCPIAKSLDLMGDRWTLLILRDLFIFPTRRYVELRDGLTGISPTLLSQRLTDLINYELIEPLDDSTTGHLTYRLTSRGKETKPVLVALAKFGLPLIDGRVDDRAWQAFTR